MVEMKASLTEILMDSKKANHSGVMTALKLVCMKVRMMVVEMAKSCALMKDLSLESLKEVAKVVSMVIRKAMMRDMMTEAMKV